MQDQLTPSDQPLSDTEMNENGFKKVILYSELGDMTLKDLLDSLPIAILYEVMPGVGHWTCLFQHRDGIEFFDSLGYVMDEELKVIGPRPGQNTPELAGMLYLLSKSGIPISYNEFKLQGDGTNTCGKWCCCRIALPNFTAKQFYQMTKPGVINRWSTADEVIMDLYKG